MYYSVLKLVRHNYHKNDEIHYYECNEGKGGPCF